MKSVREDRRNNGYIRKDFEIGRMFSRPSERFLRLRLVIETPPRTLSRKDFSRVSHTYDNQVLEVTLIPSGCSLVP